jgi:hypothetical protein
VAGRIAEEHVSAGAQAQLIALLMVALAALIALAAGVVHHQPREAAVLAGVLLAAGRWLARDLRSHPANFPASSPSHGLHMTVTSSDGARTGRPWPSHRPTDGTR